MKQDEKNHGSDRDAPAVAPPRAPEQQVSDPGALSERMDEMKRRAEEVVAKASAGHDARQAYLQGALEIHREMRPEFGPANAWLYGERAALLGRLAERLGLEPAAVASLEQPDFDGFVGHLQGLLDLCHELGLKTAVCPSNRGELAWTPAPGFAIEVRDPSRKTEWKPSYAGTSAGPDVPAITTSLSVTLFVYPRYAGTAMLHSLDRMQPGIPEFYTGSLVAYTLQPPQSDDVKPEEVLRTLLPQLQRAGLTRPVSDEVTLRLRNQLGPGVQHLSASDGLVSVSAAESLPDLSGIVVPEGYALSWMDTRGIEFTLTLSFPAVGPQ